MTDQEILRGLIARDEKITRYFFFNKCQPIFYHAINKIFDAKADYDELVNELYAHLMADDARRLRMFEGRSNIYVWLSSVARHFFLDKKNHERLIEKEHDDSLYKEARKIVDENPDRPDKKQEEEDMRVAAILDQIDNERYRLVIEKHVLEGMSFDELEKLTGISKANLYNIKMRALKKLEQIMKIARSRSDSLCAVRCEEYILHCFGIHKSLEELRELALKEGWLAEDGARIQDLGNTSQAFGLEVKKHSDASLQDIMKELEEGKQVIAAVDGGELIGDPVEERLEDVFAGGIVDHCVVVLAIDLDMDEVALFDPAFGPIPLSVPVAQFMDAWADSGYYCVLVASPKD